jgi:single-strand DNA-binding protein
MSRGINKVIVIGMLGENPDLKYSLAGKAVVNFILAVNEEWGNKENQKRTEWFNVEAIGRGAEFMGQHLHKGDYIYLEGILRTEKWEKDGITAYTSKLVVKDFLFLSPSAESVISSTNEGETGIVEENFTFS